MREAGDRMSLKDDILMVLDTPVRLPTAQRKATSTACVSSTLLTGHGPRESLGATSRPSRIKDLAVTNLDGNDILPATFCKVAARSLFQPAFSASVNGVSCGLASMPMRAATSVAQRLARKVASSTALRNSGVAAEAALGALDVLFQFSEVGFGYVFELRELLSSSGPTNSDEATNSKSDRMTKVVEVS